jgi:para-aminobenzoate synthetase component 1
MARLELDQATGAFAALEAFLDGERFWGRRGVVADLYLGYGLSAALRRSETAAPPEPLALPLLSCLIRPACEAPRAGGRFRLGDWERSWDDAGYAQAIEAVRQAIGRGDVYQANLVQHLSAPFDGDPGGVAAALAPLAPLLPRPFEGEGYALVSASPELFLRRRGRSLLTAPIKGTRPAGERVDDPKDAAEHVMIVDLERNDLARVCEPGSIRWPQLGVERELAGVSHLESRIEGRLRADATLAEILEATFPGGSITGAPKLAAIDLIAALEPVGRGGSMGALGLLRPDGDFELALTIRTFALGEGRIHLWVGGGIVWDSLAAAEIEESWVKARPLLAALAAAAS